MTDRHQGDWTNYHFLLLYQPVSVTLPTRPQLFHSQKQGPVAILDSCFFFPFLHGPLTVSGSHHRYLGHGLVVNIFFVKLLSKIVSQITLLLCSIKVYFPKAWDTSYVSYTDISPAHYCAQKYCYVLMPKQPLLKPPGRVHFALCFCMQATFTSTATTATTPP